MQIPLCEGYFVNPNHSVSFFQARNILLRARNVFRDLAEDNPNKANMAEYIEAVLAARYVLHRLRAVREYLL